MPTRLLEPRLSPDKAPASPRRTLAGLLRRADRVMDTSGGVTLAICRLILGGIMFAHGCQKLLGWFGGQGPQATIAGFREHLGMPSFVAWLVIVAEFFGSLGLILGFLGRLGALGILAVMAGAIVLVHASNGLFMNWSGSASGEGFEFHLLAIALALLILVKGSGAFSVDGAVVRWLRSKRSESA